MKILYCCALLIFTLPAWGQSDTALLKKQSRDSLLVSMQSELSISNARADSILTIIATSNAQMREIAKNQSLSKDQKLSGFHRIANQRDQTILTLLSPEQENKLKQIMSRHKARLNSQPRTILNSTDQ